MIDVTGRGGIAGNAKPRPSATTASSVIELITSREIGAGISVRIRVPSGDPTSAPIISQRATASRSSAMPWGNRAGSGKLQSDRHGYRLGRRHEQAEQWYSGKGKTKAGKAA